MFCRQCRYLFLCCALMFKEKFVADFVEFWYESCISDSSKFCLQIIVMFSALTQGLARITRFGVTYIQIVAEFLVFCFRYTFRGNKVSLLTHTCPHTSNMREIKWPFAVTRVTVHFTCGLMSDLVIGKLGKEYVSCMTLNVLRQVVIMQLNTETLL